MKDSNLVAFRLALGIIIASLAVGYIYFVFPELKSNMDSLSMENQQLENEKKDIEKIMIDPDAIRKEIETLKKELTEVEYTGVINDETAESDIVAHAQKNEIAFQGMELGEAQFFGKEKKNGEQLLYIPISLAFVSPYENAINLLSDLENSESGMYHIDVISCNQDPESGSYTWEIDVKLLYYGTY